MMVQSPGELDDRSGMTTKLRQVHIHIYVKAQINGQVKYMRYHIGDHITLTYTTTTGTSKGHDRQIYLW